MPHSAGNEDVKVRLLGNRHVDPEPHGVVIHESAGHRLRRAGHQALEESMGTTLLVKSVCQNRWSLTDSWFDPDERLWDPIAVYVQQDDIAYPNGIRTIA